METSGDLAGAGYAYEAEGDLDGVCRVRCRLLEEALYAGHVNRAHFLIGELSSMGIDASYIRFWWARLSWGCGLSDLAIESMTELGGAEQDDPWLERRALGLAQLYSGLPDSAAALLSESLRLADTNWRKFYSCIDLCMALVQSGDNLGATLLSSRLLEMFPESGLAMVLKGIVDISSGSPSRAFTYWSGVAANPIGYGAGPSSMAYRLISEYE
jgi:hypothetical protein